jgi:hypothetical protein
VLRTSAMRSACCYVPTALRFHAGTNNDTGASGTNMCSTCTSFTGNWGITGHIGSFSPYDHMRCSGANGDEASRRTTKNRRESLTLHAQTPHLLRRKHLHCIPLLSLAAPPLLLRCTRARFLARPRSQAHCAAFLILLQASKSTSRKACALHSRRARMLVCGASVIRYHHRSTWGRALPPWQRWGMTRCCAGGRPRICEHGDSQRRFQFLTVTDVSVRQAIGDRGH